MLYLTILPELNYVKPGYTNEDPEDTKNIKRFYNYKLWRVVSVRPGGLLEEAKLHIYFRNYYELISGDEYYKYPKDSSPIDLFQDSWDKIDKKILENLENNLKLVKNKEIKNKLYIDLSKKKYTMEKDNSINTLVVEKDDYCSDIIDVSPNTSIIKSIRNSGHSLFSAISDIVDNSLEESVDSKNISVSLQKSIDKSNRLSRVTIVDDGNGMDKSKLIEALKLGSITSKTRNNNLGYYGIGLKSSSMSIGGRLTIMTKTLTGPLLVSVYDEELMLKTNKFNATLKIGDKKDLEDFYNYTESNKGTCVIIDNVRSIDKQICTLTNELIKELGLNFRLFIENGVNIKVNGFKVSPIDPLHRNHPLIDKLNADNSFIEFKNYRIYYNAVYIPKDIDNDTKYEKVYRNNSNCGLYIYRNNRLVGNALSLGGVIPKFRNNDCNGLRVELFISGELDEYFGSTFLKTIVDKKKCSIDQELYDKLHQAFSPFISESYKRNGLTEKTVNINSEETFIKSISKKINKNPFLDKSRLGGSEKSEIIDLSLSSMGTGQFFDYKIKNGKYMIKFNIDHIFWKNIISSPNKFLKENTIKLIVTLILRIDSTPFSDVKLKQAIFNNYFQGVSEDLRGLLQLDNEDDGE